MALRDDAKAEWIAYKFFVTGCHVLLICVCSAIFHVMETYQKCLMHICEIGGTHKLISLLKTIVNVIFWLTLSIKIMISSPFPRTFALSAIVLVPFCLM